MEQTNQIRKRSEIPVEDTWKLEDLYASDEAWESEASTLEADRNELSSFAGHLSESPEMLFNYLRTIERV